LSWKIKDFPTDQQLFLSSFYCYLKYDKINDFVINLDNIWEWLGFSQKVNAKRLIQNQFIVNKDYKCLLFRKEEQTFMTNNEIVPHPKKESKLSHGGQNKEIIMMNITTFKKFCLKAGTKKADEIHDYFIKLEESLHEVIEEETTELKTQLLKIEDKNTKDYEVKLEKQRTFDKEKLLLQNFGSIGPIVYIIKVNVIKISSKCGTCRNDLLIDKYKQIEKGLLFLEEKKDFITDCWKYTELKNKMLE
jgi:hypothetical protein